MRLWTLYSKLYGPCSAKSTLLGARHRGVFFGLSRIQNRSLTLRPYQEECIESVLEGIGRGLRRLGISLATGAGKTVIFSRLIGRIEPHDDQATRTLVLVHRRELVLQAYQHCQAAYPNLKVEVDMGKMHASGKADITIASVMSLQRGRLKQYDPARFKLVLIDEVHHAVSQSYLNVLEYFGLISTETATAESTEPSIDADLREADKQPVSAAAQSNRGPVLVGVSATFSRFDGLSLGHVIDELVYHKDYIDLIDESWLSDVCFTTAKFKADLSKVKTHTEGDFVTSSLSAAMNTEETNELVIQTWLEKAEGRKTTLVFAVDVAHVEGLQATFREHGIDARSVTAKTPIHQRSATVEAFRAGKFPVLLNCGIFTEGTDIPNIDCVLLARPTKSRNLLVQMIGRGMRLHEGKKDCHVIDMVSALKTGIVSVPTLFGLDPTMLVDKQTVADLQEMRERYKDGVTRLPMNTDSLQDSETPSDAISGSMHFKDYNSILDLLVDEKKDLHLRQISKNAWMQVGPDKDGHERYILSGNDNSYLKITDRGSGMPRFEVTFYSKIPTWALAHNAKGMYRTALKIAYAQTLSDAVHAADKYTSDGSNSKYFPKFIIDGRQAWRTKPATASQLEILEKIGGEALAQVQGELTAGQAAIMITRIKHGGKGQYKAIKGKKARVARQQKARELEQQLKEREDVRVGPLK